MDDQEASFPNGIDLEPQQVGNAAGVVSAGHAGGQFLGQRHQGIMYTYLDLDSRCVAI